MIRNFEINCYVIVLGAQSKGSCISCFFSKLNLKGLYKEVLVMEAKFCFKKVKV